MNSSRNQKRLKQVSRLFVASAALLTVAAVTYAASNTITYQYDALGRLTFVNDAINGNRDYDYDKAGNRLLVAVGTSNDGSAVPGATPPAPPAPPPPASPPPPAAPPAPTNLSSDPNSQCSWKATWTSVLGATSYIVRDVSGNHQVTVTTNEAIYNFSDCGINPAAEKPKWVKACNGPSCSAEVNFP